jgi:hypothetical protein
VAVSETAVGEAARTVAAGAMLTASGPLLADYASIAVAGALGAMIKIGSTPAIKSSIAESMWALAIGISLAVLFGWFSAHYIAQWIGEEVDALIIPLAGVLGLIGRDWPSAARMLWRVRTGKATPEVNP